MREQHAYIRGVLETWGERRAKAIPELGYPKRTLEFSPPSVGQPPRVPGWKPSAFYSKVEQCVKQLPKPQYKVCILRFVDNLKIEEIEAVTGRARRTIEGDLQRVYKNITFMMKELTGT